MLVEACGRFLNTIVEGNSGIPSKNSTICCGGKGVADRVLVADAFFAKTEPGAVPRFARGLEWSRSSRGFTISPR